MLNLFSILKPNTVAHSPHGESDTPSVLGFNFMRIPTGLSSILDQVPPIPKDGEIFLPVIGYEDRYMVSNFGRIASLRHNGRGGFNFRPSAMIMVTRSKTSRYDSFIARGSNRTSLTKLVHRAVAEAFIPNPMNYPCVNHKDCDKLNNRVENLEWCTYKQNHTHAVENSLIKRNRGEEAGTSSLSDNDVMLIVKSKDNICVEARKWGISYGSVWNIRRGITWGHVTGLKYVKGLPSLRWANKKK